MLEKVSFRLDNTDLSSWFAAADGQTHGPLWGEAVDAEKSLLFESDAAVSDVTESAPNTTPAESDNVEEAPRERDTTATTTTTTASTNDDNDDNDKAVKVDSPLMKQSSSSTIRHSRKTMRESLVQLLKSQLQKANAEMPE